MLNKLALQDKKIKVTLKKRSRLGSRWHELQSQSVTDKCFITAIQETSVFKFMGKSVNEVRYCGTLSITVLKKIKKSAPSQVTEVNMNSGSDGADSTNGPLAVPCRGVL